MSINWLYLIIGGICETGFATSLGKIHQSTGKEMWMWIILFFIFASSSMILLFKAMGGEKAIPVGTAYAVWGAIGAIGTVIIGIIAFQEPVTFWRIFFLTILIISVVGLQITSNH